MGLKFTRQSWHRRLQRFTLGLQTTEHFDFKNLCPYFWITMLCLILFPFVGILKFVFISVSLILDFLEKYVAAPLDKWIFFPMYENRIKMWDNVDTYRAFRKGGKAFRAWQSLHPDWSKLIETYRIDYYKWMDEQGRRETANRKAKYEAAKLRQARILRAAMLLKKTFPVLAAAVVGGIVYGLYRLCRAAVHWDWHKILTNAFAFAIGGVIVLIAIGVGIGIICWIKTMINPDDDYVDDRPLRRRVFLSIKEGFADVFGIFFEYIKAIKTNYCPSIEWEE